jgi:hypothetical protein
MEAIDRKRKPRLQLVQPASGEQPRVAPIRVSGQPKPLTGRAGALAAVARLYQEHGDELKQLADA